MGWFTTFLVVLFFAFLITLLLSRQEMPVGSDLRGNVITTTNVSIGFSLFMALVIAVLVVFLIHGS